MPSQPGPSDTHDRPPPAKPVKQARPVKPVKPVRPTRAAKPAPAAKAVRPAAAAKPAQAAARQPAAPDPLVGRTIGRCRVEALIGLGRTARVYRAHFEALGTVVALKVLRNDIAQNPVLVERFQSEARAIARVDNENVLKIYDVGITDEGQHYMVVELLEGEEVLELIQREERVEPMDALRIVRQAANGLAAAHALGLVHRDVKPQNLFLLEDGTVKVVDFGLAAGIDDGTERVGTPHYMAPEVCERGAAATASDVYGLGIVLYHLLVGQPPHVGNDIQGILKAHIAGEPLRPGREVPGLAKDVAELVRTLTKRDPLLRPTALAIIDQLDVIGGKELKQKESLDRHRRRGRARAAVARRDRAEAKRSTPMIALAVGGVVALVAVIAMLSSSDEDPAPTPTVSIPLDPVKAEEERTGIKRGVIPIESEAARIEREAKLAAAQAAKEADEAFQRAEEWARANWHTPADTEAVIAKYRYVKDRFKDTKAGEAAKERISLIKDRKDHPHPDREWTGAEALEAAKGAWEHARPLVLEKIAAFDYEAARGLVPAAVSDESGTFARELDFWREFTGNLVDLRAAGTKAIAQAKADDRPDLKTPDGEGRVERIGAEAIEVRVGTKTVSVPWAKVGAGPIASMLLDMFTGDADRLILLMAFTYAHALDSFWDVQLDLGGTAGMRNHARMMQEYEKRYRERAR
ncbi:MAG: serine/threonine-protein kinase [Planctomycetota bacterium]|nr:serine/threonine-protein kinase [Planctomycetota bacterium]